MLFMGFPGSSESKESACNAGDLGLILRLERSPGEENTTPVFLPGDSHGQRSLAGYIQYMGLQRVGRNRVTNNVITGSL